LDHGLHGLQLGEMLAHVGMQDHVYYQIAKVAKVSLLHVGENVAVMLLDQPEKCRNMMVFQDSSVIIESSQTAA